MTYFERAEKLLKTPYSRLWRIDYHSLDDTTYVVATTGSVLHIRVRTLGQMAFAPPRAVMIVHD